MNLVLRVFAVTKKQGSENLNRTVIIKKNHQVRNYIVVQETPCGYPIPYWLTWDVLYYYFLSAIIARERIETHFEFCWKTWLIIDWIKNTLGWPYQTCQTWMKLGEIVSYMDHRDLMTKSDSQNNRRRDYLVQLPPLVKSCSLWISNIFLCHWDVLFTLSRDLYYCILFCNHLHHLLNR